MKKIITILFATVLSASSADSQTQKFTISNSEVKKITSAIVAGQEYVLHISLPSGYNNNKKYPVVYLMDSQWDFPLLTSLYGEQYFDGFIPSMIIVGVTWGGVNPNPDSLRARDYTPTNEKRLQQSGGADKFLSFMKTELFPFIEKNYNADANDRTLIGCSLGGLFTMYALFTQPGLFQRYVAASPAFGWGNEVIYQYEKKYFENASNPPARLYACIGGVERSVAGFEKLSKFLSDRNYSSLKIRTEVLGNTGHSGTKGEGYAHGLQYAFERQSIKLANDQLSKLSGSYRSANGNNIEIGFSEGILEITFGSNNKYALHAATPTDFYSTAEFLNIHFKKDDKNNITGFELERYTGKEFITKNK